MKEDLFDKVYHEVRQLGATFAVDFKKRSLRLNREYIIEEGFCKVPFAVEVCTPAEFLHRVELYYKAYKHSVPSERSESKGRRYFNALAESKLSDEDMMYGEPREAAQLQLELFVLLQILVGQQWQEQWGRWFWQCPEEPDLVLLREWFE